MSSRYFTSPRSVAEIAARPTAYYGRRDVDVHDFVTFTCAACTSHQTVVVRIGKRTVRCTDCDAFHRILPSERSTTIPKGTP